MTHFIKNAYYALILITILFVINQTFGQAGNNSYVFDGESGYVGIEDNNPLTLGADPTAYQYFDNPSFSNSSISVEAWVYLIGENPGVKMNGPVIQ